MRYRIHQIKINVRDISDMDDISGKCRLIEKEVKRRFRKKKPAVNDITIVRESIDARHKPDIRLVYTADFDSDTDLPLDMAPTEVYRFPAPERIAGSRPVIAGFGPCGMFAALMLAEAGLRPLVIERGAPVDERIKDVEKFWKKGILDPESNVQFGEGGAGTFSDGKMTTGIKDIRIRKVLGEFVEAGADSSILYRYKPHIGTDRLRLVVKNIRKKIEALGGEIMFRTKLAGLDVSDEDGCRKLKGIYTEYTGRGSLARRHIETDKLILAVGHSARDTFEMLYDEGVLFMQKPFSIGVRIEHPQSVIDRAQYGDERLAEKLGAADYKLNHKCSSGRGVYTFCMCPGGIVINASSEKGTAVTNGMSNSGRDSGTANSGLLVDVRTGDFGSGHPLAGMEFQRKYERLAYENGAGELPATDLGSFSKDTGDPVRKSLPGFAAEAIIEAMPHLGRKLKGFDDDSAVLTAVETRSSSPVRIPRDSDFSCSIKGICPAGEGAGYAGGIMSAAVDGIKAAEKLL